MLSREEAAIAQSLNHARSIRVTLADNSKDVTAFVNLHVSKAVEQKRLLGGRVSQTLLRKSSMVQAKCFCGHPYSYNTYPVVEYLSLRKMLWPL